MLLYDITGVTLRETMRRWNALDVGASFSVPEESATDSVDAALQRDIRRLRERLATETNQHAKFDRALARPTELSDEEFANLAGAIWELSDYRA
jgi:hypothetical protein